MASRRPRYDPDEYKWVEQANCIGVPVHIMFPSRGESIRPAQQVCRACVVRSECLEYALSHRELFGFWGGHSERERRRMRRERNRARRLGAA